MKYQLKERLTTTGLDGQKSILHEHWWVGAKRLPSSKFHLKILLSLKIFVGIIKEKMLPFCKFK